MAQLSFARRVEIAGQLSVRARTCFDLFEFFEDVATGPKINDQINEYPWFFRLHHHVYRFVFIVEIAGLFKRKVGTVNFPHLLAESRSVIKDAEWEALNIDMLNWRDVALKAEAIRSKALAHRSADVDFNATFHQANVTRKELRALSDFSLVIANRLSRATGGAENIFVTQETLMDAKRLFTVLGSTFEVPPSKGALDDLYED